MRNITGSPIAGIDPHELLDVRQLNQGAYAACMLTCSCVQDSTLCVRMSRVSISVAIPTWTHQRLVSHSTSQ